jgi:hypothetical protein
MSGWRERKGKDMPSVIIPNLCACGCGTAIPQRSEFMPGHALRYASRLRSSAANGDVLAQQEIYRRGWSLGVNKASAPYAFGFEAEFFGMEQNEAAEVLTENGIYTEDDGYHHRTVDYWRITEDGSVSQEGCELVSPILHSRKKPDMDVSRLALSVLQRHGGRVNRSCGLHVHHNLRGKKVADVAETVAHWAAFQPLIEKLLPASRWSGSYSNSMRDGGNWYRSVTTRYGAEHAASSLSGGPWGRYHAVNLQAITDHGTLEYRQHSGTLNGDKLEMWVLFTRALHDVRKVGTYSTLLDIYGSDTAICDELKLDGMMKYLGLPRRVRQFYVDRATALHGPGNYGIDDEDSGGSDDDYEDDDYEDGYENEDGGLYCSSCGEFHYDEV